MNKMGIAFLGAVIWLIGVVLSVSAILGKRYAMSIFVTWYSMETAAVLVSAIGILFLASGISALRKYLGPGISKELNYVQIIQGAGLLAGAATLILAILLITVNPLTAVTRAGMIGTIELVSFLLMSILLVMLGLILFMGRQKMEVTTKISTMSELAFAGAMMSTIAGFVILIELVLPSNIGIFVLIPALTLDVFVFLRLSYFE